MGKGWQAPPVRLLTGILDLILYLAALVGLAAVAAAASDALDLANHLALVWLIPGVVAGAAALAFGGHRRRLARAAAFAVVLVAAGVRIGPELVARWRLENPRTAPLLRVVQFNTWDENPQPEIAARWLLAQDADVLVLEEVAFDSPLRTKLATAYPHLVACAPLGRCSTVILSRRVPLASGGLARGDPENRRAVSAAWATFAGPLGPFTVVALHLNRPWPWAQENDAPAEVARFLGTVDGRTAIVGGDFNRAAWSAAIARIDRAFALRRVTRAMPSWPARSLQGWRLWPFIPIDHVYAGRGWQVREVHRGPYLGSDHLPIVVTLGAARSR
jgi:endonuclease/exonuclease/phosphatase (EEP) superfamily protein YafD